MKSVTVRSLTILDDNSCIQTVEVIYLRDYRMNTTLSHSTQTMKFADGRKNVGASIWIYTFVVLFLTNEVIDHHYWLYALHESRWTFCHWVLSATAVDLNGAVLTVIKTNPGSVQNFTSSESNVFAYNCCNFFFTSGFHSANSMKNTIHRNCQHA